MAVLIYVLLYVPIILTFAFASRGPVDQIIAVQLTFMIGMALIFLADVIIVRNPIRLTVQMDLMPIVLSLTCVGVVYMLVVYRGNLHFPSFGEDLYTVRAENESLGAGLVTRYVSSWLSTVLVPLCLAYGLTRRAFRYFLVGCAACLVLYLATSIKIIILLPCVYVGFYYLVRKRLSAFYSILTATVSVVILGLMRAAQLGGIAFVVSSVVLMRTIGNGGQLTLAYYEFFLTHPRTDYSHVNGIKLLVHRYPYGSLPVGQVVGQYFWSPEMNANANFWATDGVAAMGMTGVLIVSVLCALFFMAMNSITDEHDPLFVLLCFLSFANILLNQSLFSAIWSGGGFFLLLFFMFYNGCKFAAKE